MIKLPIVGFLVCTELKPLHWTVQYSYMYAIYLEFFYIWIEFCHNYKKMFYTNGLEAPYVLFLFFFSNSFSSVKNELLPSHPLELSEKNVSGPETCHKSGIFYIFLFFFQRRYRFMSVVGPIEFLCGLTVVTVVFSSGSTRTRWISPHSGISRVFMPHLNCRWSTRQPDR